MPAPPPVQEVPGGLDALAVAKPSLATQECQDNAACLAAESLQQQMARLQAESVQEQIVPYKERITKL